jgi:fumarate reductase subunit D
VGNHGYRYLQDYNLGKPQPKPVLRSMELGPRDRLSQAFVHEDQKGRTIPTEYGSVVHLDDCGDALSKPSNEAFFWLLFSAGGVVAAVLVPIQLFLFGLAFLLGWISQPSYEHLMALVRSPLARVYLFTLYSFPLFHWAHRFRFTLYAGLQVKHLNEVIFAFCYGGALVGTVLAGYLMWKI